jgi:hypothetical protein
MNKFMAAVVKWFTRSTALFVGIAFVVIAFGFAIGKIGSLSIRIQHPVPDFEFETHAPAPTPTVAARPKIHSSHASAPVIAHPGGPQYSRSKVTSLVADGAEQKLLR